MKAIYEKPFTDVFEIRIEGNYCLSGGRPGGDGDPGAAFDPDYDDIFDGGDL